MTADRPGALGAIGNTPVVRLNRLAEPGMGDVWVKLDGSAPAPESRPSRSIPD
jgi:cysteine synthase